MSAASASASASAFPDVSADRLRPRSAERPGLGVAYAACAHLLLIAALSFGVSWKIAQPEGGEVELWSGVPQAAPAALPPEAAEAPPTPVERTPPPPPPAPAQAVQPPTPPAEPPPQRPPADLQEAPLAKPVKAQPPPKPVKAEPPPKPAKPVPPPKPAGKTPAKAVPKPEPKKAAQAAEAARPRADAAPALRSQREAAMNRLLSELGAEGGTGSARSSKPAGGRMSAAYAGRVKARIKPNIVFTEAVSGNPMAVVRVRCDATGRIVSQQLTESSGLPAWDEAVQRAITRTEVLPLDEDGRCPTMELAFRPQDF